MQHLSLVPLVCSMPVRFGICLLFRRAVAVVLPSHRLVLGDKTKLQCSYWKGRQAVLRSSHRHAAKEHSRATVVLRPVCDVPNPVMVLDAVLSVRQAQTKLVQPTVMAACGWQGCLRALHNYYHMASMLKPWVSKCLLPTRDTTQVEHVASWQVPLQSPTYKHHCLTPGLGIAMTWAPPKQCHIVRSNWKLLVLRSPRLRPKPSSMSPQSKQELLSWQSAVDAAKKLLYLPD
mmetsp:Transcript_73012/g.144734  ORF Transcript_73012/g.144734 Transcript_73012/m.144734 type:complete len:232 (+) Transcript_73012:1454-2149(+)